VREPGVETEVVAEEEAGHIDGLGEAVTGHDAMGQVC
jgi:hypothetical protein